VSDTSAGLVRRTIRDVSRLEVRLEPAKAVREARGVTGDGPVARERLGIAPRTG